MRMSWSGLYEVTPDHHAVVGPAPGVPGFFVASGFSGHGIMHAPAAGRAVAELCSADGARRWTSGRSRSIGSARGALIHETMVL